MNNGEQSTKGITDNTYSNVLPELIIESGVELTADVIIRAYIRIALSDICHEVEQCRPSERLKALDFLAQYLQILPQQTEAEEAPPPLTIQYDYQ